MILTDKVMELGIIFQLFERRFGIVFKSEKETTRTLLADSQPLSDEYEKVTRFSDFASAFLNEAETARRADKLSSKVAS